MDGVALAGLVAKLAVTVQVLTAYPVVEPPPAIQLLPQAELNEIVCTSFCNAQGAYLPERGLLLAGNLDPVGNVRDRAVLLHELVHLHVGRAAEAHAWHGPTFKRTLARAMAEGYGITEVRPSNSLHGTYAEAIERARLGGGEQLTIPLAA